MRLVTSHDVARMSYQRGHQARTASGKLWPASSFHSLPDKSVTLLDKGFFVDLLLLRIQAEDTDRHWLIPERKGCYSWNLSAMATVTVCVEMTVSPQAHQEKPTL